MTIGGANWGPIGANTVIGAGAAQNNKTAGNAFSSALGARRFDKLDLSRFGQRYLEASDAEKAQVLKMIRDADEMYGYSNFEKAEESYWTLKKMLNDEIERSESDIKKVEEYQKALEYYQNILDKNSGDDIYIDSDKYGWISASMGSKFHNGSYISRSDLIKAMSEAKSRVYDSCIGRYTNEVDYEDYCRSVSEDGGADYSVEMQKLAEKLGISPEELLSKQQEKQHLGSWANIQSRKFEKYANIFSSITGEKVSYQSAGENNPLFSREGLTLDNFIEKTTERIGRLQDCEKSLKNAMDKYITGLNPRDLAPSDNFLEIKLEMFFRQQEALSEILYDFDKGNEQVSETL